MPAKPFRTLEMRSRRQWRTWLQKNHDSVTEIWLVFHKLHMGKKCIEYGDALDEALCFGWIDSLVKRLDDDRYARKFTPRKPDSRWSAINRRRYAKLKADGLLAAPGLARAPTDRVSTPPQPWASTDITNIENAFKANTKVWATFRQLSPSCQRAYLGWIDSAKREETKQKRLREAVKLLAAGKKLGLR